MDCNRLSAKLDYELQLEAKYRIPGKSIGRITQNHSELVIDDR